MKAFDEAPNKGMQQIGHKTGLPLMPGVMRRAIRNGE
jgi:hypothetical protein